MDPIDIFNMDPQLDMLNISCCEFKQQVRAIICELLAAENNIFKITEK